ncbi:hypothetical protein [Pontibacter mangrovi]|uniref:Initiator Rep protein domain-containing protein n=2 Tax=Pseudomonadati TaxID=3379134 RepID=A0A501WGD2_9RHOB|nr:hypothetical protein [Pontibacter mangrovi]TPE41495.1 hypothetical protein FJM65_19030 [Pontibacter mangrovi]TPE48629.1 hypothetical protein FJM51_16840 [Amaricoccus solimangrovi]
MQHENKPSETFLSDPTYFLSRIDRSVADNIRDIEKSFDEDAGIVKDFIVFISRKMKKDLFGFTRFTLSEFCKETGRNKQTLCEVHPKFKNNPKAEVPEYFGHRFETTFDYALFHMLSNNIIFSRSYEYKHQDKVIELKNFAILKDIKVSIDRHTNTIKIYDVRISDELMEGFFRRYYTIDTNGYKHVGKGRGGDGRKSLYIFLYKTRHQLLSSGKRITKLPIDLLASVAHIESEEPRFKKKSVKRVLDYIREKGKLPFDYTFVQGDPTKKYQELYWVSLDFSVYHEVMEAKEDHNFYIALLERMRDLFHHTYGNHVQITGEKDTFQRWLTNSDADLTHKANELCKAYFKVHNKDITLAMAKKLIRGGLFSDDN